jgi:hypothetical protein
MSPPTFSKMQQSRVFLPQLFQKCNKVGFSSPNFFQHRAKLAFSCPFFAKKTSFCTVFEQKIQTSRNSVRASLNGFWDFQIKINGIFTAEF